MLEIQKVCSFRKVCADLNVLKRYFPLTKIYVCFMLCSVVYVVFPECSLSLHLVNLELYGNQKDPNLYINNNLYVYTKTIFLEKQAILISKTQWYFF